MFKRFTLTKKLGIALPVEKLVSAALRDFSYEKITYGPIGHDLTAGLYHVCQNNIPTTFAYMCKGVW